MPAMFANDDAGRLALCGGLSAAIAGKPAPTGKHLLSPLSARDKTDPHLEPFQLAIMQADLGQVRAADFPDNRQPQA